MNRPNVINTHITVAWGLNCHLSVRGKTKPEPELLSLTFQQNIIKTPYYFSLYAVHDSHPLTSWLRKKTFSSKILTELVCLCLCVKNLVMMNIHQ